MVESDYFGTKVELGSVKRGLKLPTGESISCTFMACILERTSGCWGYLQDKAECSLGKYTNCITLTIYISYILVVLTTRYFVLEDQTKPFHLQFSLIVFR